jgi:hypothetical protein
LHSFEQFWLDMGPTYQRGLDLDRRDNDQGYNAQNCRWVERKVNLRNTRKNRMIETPFGNITVSAFAELTDIGVTTILYRINHHWPTELLCTPPDVRNKCTTLQIVDRDTALLSGMGEQEKPA